VSCSNGLRAWEEHRVDLVLLIPFLLVLTPFDRIYSIITISLTTLLTRVNFNPCESNTIHGHLKS
jgi:hypothetical protein